ncbi:hypothetical protein EHS25_001122 [Saitozyma podzolica]|uniref:pectinesterase n=1 Tax=Saitozyma podzolica TaxID=1890683 RepID=A0A427YHK1_9TREE|nr:hypothetical protein EHS25_001122 [Saitozyma podzolica]
MEQHTDPQAGYGTINGALAALPNDTSPQVILVGPGSYHEVLNITRQAPLTLLGITPNPEAWETNLVHVWNSSYINQTTQLPTQHNADACVLTIGPYGPGSSDFKMYNIDVANRATVNGVEYKLGQTGPSAALFVTNGNASFYQSTFRSYQDTLYVGQTGNAVFSGGQVVGATDYIYGYGKAYFQGTQLANRGNGGGIVAWKGTAGNNTYGAYFNNSAIVAATDPEPGVNLTYSCPLGRPWNNMSRAVYMNTYMSDIVLPQGFMQWQPTNPQFVPNLTIFVESGSYGPGWKPRQRNETLESVISPQEATTRFSIEKVFGTFPSWVDTNYVYH